MGDMVEKVARAICASAAEPGENDYDLDRVFWDRSARVAITTIRDHLAPHLHAMAEAKADGGPMSQFNFNEAAMKLDAEFSQD